MSIDLSRVTGISDSRGVITEIKDSLGRVIWAMQSGDKAILEVEKFTSNTYAGETTYENEQLILLDIYPKTNGTVSVTYGGLTKTITDTSGAAEPNAQQVYFGTFNGSSDSVTTPASGRLTIEGDCRGFGYGSYNQSSKTTSKWSEIQNIISFGAITVIPDGAFSPSITITPNIPNMTSLKIPQTVERIGNQAFYFCKNLQSVFIPKSVVNIGNNPWQKTAEKNVITVDGGNPHYKIDGNCLVEIPTGRLISGFNDGSIPSYITSIGYFAFYGCVSLTSVTIPSGVTTIGSDAFRGCSGLTSITVLATTPPDLSSNSTFPDSVPIIVPKGCGAAYKAADIWSQFADYIEEVS